MKLEYVSDDIFSSPEVKIFNHFIRIIELKKSSSTQKILESWWKNHTESLNFTPVLLSYIQENGIGQRDRIWESNSGSLTFSTILDTHPHVTWTPLEIAVLLSEILFEQFHVKTSLKWPNDLCIYGNKKVAGILCQGIKKKVLLGIGINLFDSKENSIQNVDAGFLQSNILSEMEKLKLTSVIMNYIINNRHKNDQETKEKWINKCNHLNTTVLLHDKNSTMRGTFIGLGNFGEAHISDGEGKDHLLTTGLLSIN